MNAKDLLEQGRGLDFEIHAKVKQAEKMEAALVRAYSLNGNVEAKPAIEFAGIALKIRHGVKRLDVLADEARAKIGKLKTSKHRQVLMLRYFLCYSWNETAQEMKYSIRQTHRIHAAAIEELDKVFRATANEGASV